MFYGKKLIILDNETGLTDENGIFQEGREIELKSIDCDVQPYSSDLLYRDYGYREQVTKRVFCDIEPVLEIGVKVEYLNDRYQVKRIITWDDYMEVMIDNL